MVDCINEIRLVVVDEIRSSTGDEDAGRMQRLCEDRVPARILIVALQAKKNKK